MSKNGLPLIAALTVFYSLLFTPSAFAYIDPGTGSMILQALLAGLVAVLAFWKQIWARVSLFLAKDNAGQAVQEDKSSDD